MKTFLIVFKLQSGHEYMIEMVIYKTYRVIIPKVGKPVMVLIFCMSSHDALYFCKVS